MGHPVHSYAIDILKHLYFIFIFIRYMCIYFFFFFFFVVKYIDILN